MAKELVKMAIDAFKGTTGEFSKDQVNDSIRKALIELNGGSEKITDRSFRKHPELFEFLEETLQVLVSEGLTNQFDGFAEVRNVPFGAQNVFHVPNLDLFKVAVISDGNGNIRRQRIDSSELTISTKWRGIKIYEELSRLMAGVVDWAELVNRVARSYNQQIANEVYTTLYDSYSNLNATYGVTGSYTESALIDLAQHVESATGANVSILGTKKALSKVTTAKYSDGMADRINNFGYLGTIAGYEMREIKQAHKVGTDTFAINDSFLLVVPNLDNSMVKIVNEGEARIKEIGGVDNADMSQEYFFGMKTGIGIVAAHKYGIYRLS